MKNDLKVIEIVEILNFNDKNVSLEDIYKLLENVGILNADKDFEVDAETVKKIGGFYKIKDIAKAKKDMIRKLSGKEEEEKRKKAEAERIQKEAELALAEETRKIAEAEEEKKKQAKKDAKKAANEAKQKALDKAPREAKKAVKEADLDDDLIKDIEVSSQYEEKYGEYSSEEKKASSRLKNIKKKIKHNDNDRQENSPIQKEVNSKVLYYSDGMSVAKIADELNKSIGEVVKKLIQLGYMCSASEVLDRDTIELLCLEYGIDVKNEINDDITKFEEMDIVDDPKDLVSRPPIVTIMGHVDHGKTTLLDTIRHSKVVNTEAGGITQRIGAYQVKEKGQYITFIDTPGHAAFTQMRARGANITDIVVLIVAADDGVMPQTIEAIEHSKAAKVPIIVAVNKMDKPGANMERIKEQLAQHDLMCEEWGGKTIFVPVSALTGKGVDELLEMILLEAEMQDYKSNPNRLAYGTILEARLDKGKGPVAAILVKNGSLKVGDPIVAGDTWGKVRAMQDEYKSNVKVATPSKAVEITGLDSVPCAGDRFMVFSDEKTARLVCEERKNRSVSESHKQEGVSLASLFQGAEDLKELNLIIKADLNGSLEAISNSLMKLDVAGAKINIVRGGVGAVTDTDISLAQVSHAIIVAFNVRSNSKLMDDAKSKGIEIRYYDIIYKFLEDVEKAMTGLLDPVFEEKVIGQAVVRQIYNISKVGTIAGAYVTSGLITRNCSIRLIRQGVVVHTGTLSTLKRFKDDVKEVKLGFECGIMLNNYNDVKIDDVIEGYIMSEVDRNAV